MASKGADVELWANAPSQNFNNQAGGILYEFLQSYEKLQFYKYSVFWNSLIF